MAFALLFLTALMGYSWHFVIAALRGNRIGATSDLLSGTSAQRSEAPVIFRMMLSAHLVLALGSLAAIVYTISVIR